MRFFLAGIMQGSRTESTLHDQSYREKLQLVLSQQFPDSEIYDPLSDHQSSLDYNDDQARNVFYYHNRLCREVDVVVAFVPSASMGTAIEMWEAHEHGRAVVIAISPLARNWAVRYCSHVVYSTFDQFEQAASSGELARTIQEIRQTGTETLG